jgi:hypothetical protein
MKQVTSHREYAQRLIRKNQYVARRYHKSLDLPPEGELSKWTMRRLRKVDEVLVAMIEASKIDDRIRKGILYLNSEVAFGSFKLYQWI